MVREKYNRQEKGRPDEETIQPWSKRVNKE